LVREPYYRGKSSKGISGAGLGLYFVERIVEAHGGRLFIESDVGNGTKVMIDLPQSRGATP
jgi:signal transduction histidine kinase